MEPVPEVSGFNYRDPLVAHYSYAHHADFLRLDALAQWGGIYADLDSLFVAPLPEPASLGLLAMGSVMLLQRRR